MMLDTSPGWWYRFLISYEQLFRSNLHCTICLWHDTYIFGRYPCSANFISFTASNLLNLNSPVSIDSSMLIRRSPSTSCSTKAFTQCSGIFSSRRHEATCWGFKFLMSDGILQMVWNSDSDAKVLLLSLRCFSPYSLLLTADTCVSFTDDIAPRHVSRRITPNRRSGRVADCRTW